MKAEQMTFGRFMAEQPTHGSADSFVPNPPAWKGTRLLNLVRDWNAHCLGTLAQLARHEARSAVGIVGAHRDLWTQMDDAACRLGAQCPFLLVDVHFSDEEWWCGSHRQRCVHNTPASHWPHKLDASLTREALMLAWLGSVCDRRAVSVLFGMAPAVAAFLSKLGPHDVDRIAAQERSQIRFRWETHPTFWLTLLQAAIAGDAPTLNDLHLYGFQLIGSEILHCSSESSFSGS